MNHIKGLTQAKLEFKEKPVSQADVILRKYGEVLKKFQELGVRYQKLERRTNNFSYRNALEVKKAKKHISEDKALKQLLIKEIDMRNQLIRRLQKDIQQDEKQLKKWRIREKLEREQVR